MGSKGKRSAHEENIQVLTLGVGVRELERGVKIAFVHFSSFFICSKC